MGTPRLDIDLRKLHYNAHTLVGRFGIKGVSVTGMTKAVLGLPDVAKVLFALIEGKVAFREKSGGKMFVAVEPMAEAAE